MKKFLALALIVALLCGLALAEDRPYVRQIHQNTYVNTLFITPESYPEIRISPAHSYSLFSGYDDPWFISFSVPENARMLSFDVDECSCANVDEGIQYSYEALGSYSFESLLNNCENDDYIIADGSAGYAAYIDPGRDRAYGLVGVPEISKGAKLYFVIYMGNHFAPAVSEERRAEELAKVVVAECERILGEKRVALQENFWENNLYCGVKMPSLEYESDMIVFDNPRLPIPTENGDVVAEEAYLYALDDNYMSFCAIAGDCWVGIDVSLETYSYLENQKEEEPDDCNTITLSDGSTFDVYMSFMSENGKTGLVYCSMLLANDAGYKNDENYYLNIEFDANNTSWTSVDQITAMLEAVMQGVRFTDVDSDPYVPGEGLPAGVVIGTPAPAAADEGAAPTADEGAAPAAAPAPASGWVCAACGAENSGNFCTNCGEKAPATGWVCPSCSAENEGNFCANCGTKRP